MPEVELGVDVRHAYLATKGASDPTCAQSSLLLLPGSVLAPRPPHLTLLQKTLAPPFLPRCINIARRLDCDTGPWPLGRNLFTLVRPKLGHIDMLARIELKRWLRAQDFEMQLRGRVRERD